jgi:putative addiction module component (TIGR02574 family)
MSDDAQLLLSAALKLPPAEREQLAEQIYRSLQDEDRPTAAEAREIERRVQEMRSGKVPTVPGDEAYEQILRRLRERRGAQP